MKGILLYFESSSQFRKWLEVNYETETELLLGYFKVGTKRKSISWSESVDEALCFGWIDGIRKSIDDESYCIRFTPRKPKSNWSAVNIRKVEEMIGLGKMTSAGLAAFEKRSELKSAIYSYENQTGLLVPEWESLFMENSVAWDFFIKQAPSYRKARIEWVMEAKKEATKLSRLLKLIDASEKGGRLY
jgi:uncharacterized protein YdeI (YjbR/CyaY-like superfamily)